MGAPRGLPCDNVQGSHMPFPEVRPLLMSDPDAYGHQFLLCLAQNGKHVWHCLLRHAHMASCLGCSKLKFSQRIVVHFLTVLVAWVGTIRQNYQSPPSATPFHEGNIVHLHKVDHLGMFSKKWLLRMADLPRSSFDNRTQKGHSSNI